MFPPLGVLGVTAMAFQFQAWKREAQKGIDPPADPTHHTHKEQQTWAARRLNLPLHTLLVVVVVVAASRMDMDTRRLVDTRPLSIQISTIHMITATTRARHASPTG